MIIENMSNKERNEWYKPIVVNCKKTEFLKCIYEILDVRNGIRYITEYDTLNYGCNNAGELIYVIDCKIEWKELNRIKVKQVYFTKQKRSFETEYDSLWVHKIDDYQEYSEIFVSDADKRGFIHTIWRMNDDTIYTTRYDTLELEVYKDCLILNDYEVGRVRRMLYDYNVDIWAGRSYVTDEDYTKAYIYENNRIARKKILRKPFYTKKEGTYTCFPVPDEHYQLSKKRYRKSRGREILSKELERRNGDHNYFPVLVRLHALKDFWLDGRRYEYVREEDCAAMSPLKLSELESTLKQREACIKRGQKVEYSQIRAPY